MPLILKNVFGDAHGETVVVPPKKNKKKLLEQSQKIAVEQRSERLPLLAAPPNHGPRKPRAVIRSNYLTRD